MRSPQPEDRPTPARRLVRQFGWRLFALPALAAVTVVVLVRPDGHAAAAPPAAVASAGVASTGRVPVSSHPAAPSSRPVAPVTVQVMTDSTACLNNTHASEAVVSISQQHVWMCEGPRQVYSTAATTGATAKDEATPIGSWVVQDRQTNRYLVGPGYKDYVHFWVPFNGDFGFHDASWQTMPFGASGYPTQGSNGCVHLPNAAMSWFYNWAQAGTTVVTVDA